MLHERRSPPLETAKQESFKQSGTGPPLPPSHKRTPPEKRKKQPTSFHQARTRNVRPGAMVRTPPGAARPDRHSPICPLGRFFEATCEQHPAQSPQSGGRGRAPAVDEHAPPKDSPAPAPAARGAVGAPLRRSGWRRVDGGAGRPASLAT